MSGMQVNLPDLVTLQLPGADVATILNALQELPFKKAFPLLGVIEQQLLSQQLPKQPAADSQAAE
jgi:hypothetical protein